MVLLLVGVAVHNLSEINQTIDRWEYLKKYGSNTYTTNPDNYESMRTIELAQISEN
jgi:hypothetical protein